MRIAGIILACLGAFTVLAASFAMWLWSRLSGWSNDEGTSIFLVGLFAAIPTVIGGLIFYGIGLVMIANRRRTGQHRSDWALRVFHKVFFIWALIVLFVFAILHGLRSQFAHLSDTIEIVSAACVALGFVCFGKLCVAVARPAGEW